MKLHLFYFIMLTYISVKGKTYMNYINRKEVEFLGKKDFGKENFGIRDEKLYQYFLTALEETKKYYDESTSFEIAQFTNYVDHWLKDNKKNPTYQNYGVGSILYVDFGAMNFGFELSFPHPCVVIAESGAFILAAPCSTKKFGHDFPDIIEGSRKDGFSQNTGIVLDNIKWISKGRVIAKMGKVNDGFLKFLVKKALSYFPIDRQEYVQPL